MELLMKQIPAAEIPDAVFYRNRYVFQISLAFADTERRVYLGELRVAWSDDTGEYIPTTEYTFDNAPLHVMGLSDRNAAMAFFKRAYQLDEHRSYDEFVAWWRTQNEKTLATRIGCLSCES